MRILFVCDADSAFAVPAMRECLRLCNALALMGVPSLVLRYWPTATSQTEPRHAAKVQDRPFAVYCSRWVRAEAALLALIEQPTVAITLGHDPIALAQTLLDGGTPCIACFFDAPGFQSFPAGSLDRRLGLAAAGAALAAQLSTLAGKPVATLLPPLSRSSRLSNTGPAILVPAIRRVDGIQRVLEMARARPDYQFIAIASQGHAALEQTVQSGAPANFSVLDEHRVAGGFRCAILPTLGSDLPWNGLAECLAAGLPILGSSEPLLQDAIGDAGLVLPATASLEQWLLHLDMLMSDDAARQPMSEAATRQGGMLRLPAQLAASHCVQVASEHIASHGHLLSGRL